MTEKVLITGATGFVGRALVRHLLASGTPAAALRCLVRRPEAALQAGLPAASLVRGQLSDPASLASACAGVSSCYHLAGAIRALSARAFLASNAEGTQNLVLALERAAPQAALVHVSSLAAAGPSADGSTSALPPERCRPPSWYGESKRQGELAVAASRALRWVIVRPPIVYGPCDSATSFLLRQALGPLCAVPRPPRPLSLLHVDDAVRALRLAGAAALHAKVLPLDGPERLDTSELMRTIAAACGRGVRLVGVPLWLARCAAVPAELLARMLGRPGMLSFDKLREIAAVGWVADPAPAREALGFVAEVWPRDGFARVACAEGLIAAPAARGVAC